MFTAPQPPRRDPRTSLSKVKGKYISEELNELGAYFFFFNFRSLTSQMTQSVVN